MSNPPETYLDQLAPGSVCIVRELHGGRGFTARLAGIGISSGCRITVLQNPSRGPLLVLVRGTRIALGRGEAAKVQVSEVEQETPDAGG